MSYSCLCVITKRSEQQARQIFNKWASKLPTNLVELFPEQLSNCLDTHSGSLLLKEALQQGASAIWDRMCLLGLDRDLSFPYSAPPWLADPRRAFSPFPQDSAPARLQPRLCASDPAPTLRPLLPFLSLRCPGNNC